MNNIYIFIIFSLKQLLPTDLVRLITLKSYVPVLIESGYEYTIIYGSIIRLFGIRFKNESEILQMLPRANKVVNENGLLVILSEGNMYMSGTFGPNYPKYKTLHKLNLKNIKSISASSLHIIAIAGSDSVYALGYNKHGQLGLGDETNRYELTKIPINNIKLAVCGHFFTCLLSNDNQIYASGNNSSGQLGLGSNHSIKIFEKLNLIDVVTISTGLHFVIALLKFGFVYSWGLNDYGQLGLGDYHSYNSPQKVKLLDEKIISISSQRNHVMVLSDNGTVFTWGVNEYGRPQKINIANIIEIFCGHNCNFVVSAIGNIYSWGSGSVGQLGLDDKTYQHKPQLVKI